MVALVLELVEVQVAKTLLIQLLVHIMHMVLSMQISSHSKLLISSLMGTATVDRMRQSNTVSAWVLVSWPWQQRMKRSMSNLRTLFTTMQTLQSLVRLLLMVWVWSCLVVQTNVLLKK